MSIEIEVMNMVCSLFVEWSDHRVAETGVFLFVNQ